MLKNTNAPKEATAAPALAPDLLGVMKKQEMKQAIVERFSAKAQTPSAAVHSRVRSPYWQPADEEC